MARIELSGVDKIYGKGPDAVHAVRKLDMAVEDGEFVALLGPSGCGKTSTLRMIVGLEHISGGQISFNGKRVNELDPQQRNVAMAFETYALYPNFTVRENLSFPLEVAGVAPAARAAEVDQIAQVLDLGPILGRLPGELSGGQQQRVSLGRALVRKPAAFILDEVMSHIDSHLKFQMLAELKSIHCRLGRTMLYVTHDQMEALALADRIAVMSEAKLQQVATRAELYRRPANVFVADFIGEPPINIMPARYDADAGVLRVAGSALAVPAPAHAARAGSGDVLVGLRPQYLRVSASATGIAGEVVISEYQGERAMLVLKNESVRFRALVAGSDALRPGASAWFVIAPEDVILFNADTQELLAP